LAWESVLLDLRAPVTERQSEPLPTGPYPHPRFRATTGHISTSRPLARAQPIHTQPNRPQVNTHNRPNRSCGPSAIAPPAVGAPASHQASERHHRETAGRDGGGCNPPVARHANAADRHPRCISSRVEIHRAIESPDCTTLWI